MGCEGMESLTIVGATSFVIVVARGEIGGSLVESYGDFSESFGLEVGSVDDGLVESGHVDTGDEVSRNDALTGYVATNEANVFLNVAFTCHNY